MITKWPWLKRRPFSNLGLGKVKLPNWRISYPRTTTAGYNDSFENTLTCLPNPQQTCLILTHASIFLGWPYVNAPSLLPRGRERWMKRGVKQYGKKWPSWRSSDLLEKSTTLLGFPTFSWSRIQMRSGGCGMITLIWIEHALRTHLHSRTLTDWAMEQPGIHHRLRKIVSQLCHLDWKMP